MSTTVQSLQKYLEETLCIEVSISPWKEKKKLPIFLENTYHFFETKLLNTSCLLLIAKDKNETTPSTIQKHLEQIAKNWNEPCIYVLDTISSYSRKQLVQRSIPFVVPNNQIYLPDLGLDFKEYFRQHRISRTFFSPSTQAVVIFSLHNKQKEAFTPSEIAKALNYSLMTMTRSFNELEEAGIGQMINKGKERKWIFEDGKQKLWKQTKTMLNTPIQTKLWIKGQHPKNLAGISALSEMTMLNAPLLPTYAMGIKEWKKCSAMLSQLPSKDEADFELEVWRYDPNLFSKEDRVDPFSLYLSLQNNKDERVEAALEEIEGKFKW